MNRNSNIRKIQEFNIDEHTNLEQTYREFFSSKEQRMIVAIETWMSQNDISIQVTYGSGNTYVITKSEELLDRALKDFPPFKNEVRITVTIKEKSDGYKDFLNELKTHSENKTKKLIYISIASHLIEGKDTIQNIIEQQFLPPVLSETDIDDIYIYLIDPLFKNSSSQNIKINGNLNKILEIISVENLKNKSINIHIVEENVPTMEDFYKHLIPYANANTHIFQTIAGSGIVSVNEYVTSDSTSLTKDD